MDDFSQLVQDCGDVLAGLREHSGSHYELVAMHPRTFAALVRRVKEAYPCPQTALDPWQDWPLRFAGIELAKDHHVPAWEVKFYERAADYVAEVEERERWLKRYRN